MPTISSDVKRSQANRLGGFTLVELLVVISIIGVLMALIMPAINSAREAGRRATCEGNLHQLTAACVSYEAKWQAFPSGGWGKWFAGSPDHDGPGTMQPGGWHYNILPFIDLNDLHEMGRNGDMEQGRLRAQTVVSIFLCPTRHRVQAFSFSSGSYANINNPQSIIGRSDYAGNAGSNFADPGSGTSYSQSTNWATVPGTIGSIATSCNGAICRASGVRTAQIKDGLSYTYLIGERFMTVGAYNQGTTENDAGWDSGYDYNTIRWTGTGPSAPLAPFQDRDMPVSTNVASLFGSAHPAGFHMAFCDGSVRKMNYNVKPTVHASLGARADGQPTQLQDIEGDK